MSKIYYILWIVVFLATSIDAIAENSSYYKDKYVTLTNIPTLYIETNNNEEISSKTEYIYCKIVMNTGNELSVYDSVQIKGRGNTSWWSFEKKPYRIKFNKKEQFLGKKYANAKNWVLLSNGGERLLIRNGLANYVSSLCNMPFTPATVYVDLYVNGVYQGNYQISDFIDIRKKRVDIEEQDTVVTNIQTNITGGYLLEVDGNYEEGETYITTPVFGNTIRIHSPKPEVVSQTQIDYIYDHLKKFENELLDIDLTSSNNNNYRNYVDSTSLMGWYLTNEICANTDMFWQIYFYKDRDDDKFYFGPVWDFDLAFNGDTRRGYNGDVREFLMADIDFDNNYFQSWFKTLRKDPWWIRSQFKAFHELYKEHNLDSCMLSYIDSVVTTMRTSIDENYKVWSISEPLHPIRDYRLYDTYDDYVDDLRDFIVKHNAYLYSRFEELYKESYTNIDYNRREIKLVQDYYSIEGVRIKRPQKGLNIIISPDGKAKKVFIK